MACALFPFLNIGTMLACFQSKGSSPCWKEALNMSVKMGAISWTADLSSRGGKLSGPGDFWISNVERISATSFTWNFRGWISG